MGLTKFGGGSSILNGPNTFSGAVVVTSTAANSSGLTVTNKDALGSATFPSSVTIKAGGGGGQGTFLTLNVQTNDNIGNLRPLRHPSAWKASCLAGCQTISETLQGWCELRGSLATNSNNNWAGPITITGNHFAQFHQTTAAIPSRFPVNVAAGAGGFSGPTPVAGVVRLP